MTKEKFDFDEVAKMLDDAVSHIHNCESWNGGDDGFKARVLIGEVKQKLKELKKESEND